MEFGKLIRILMNKQLSDGYIEYAKQGTTENPVGFNMNDFAESFFATEEGKLVRKTIFRSMKHLETEYGQKTEWHPYKSQTFTYNRKGELIELKTEKFSPFRELTVLHYSPPKLFWDKKEVSRIPWT